ncbi:hypothetical protein [Prochlorothrix hollandica]|uniref:hypothetical protein n=1 Tax=Prochlorothrix hollandica TaxID=1223 RepID=UPI0015662045
MPRLGVTWGGFPDFGRGNPPVVAPVGGCQEGRHGGATPTRGRWFPSKLNPFETVLTGDRRAETLLTSSPPE